MRIELYASVAAVVISLLTFCFSVVVYARGLSRERRQATLDAFEKLQNEALDALNKYTGTRIKEISENPRSQDYKDLSAMLARCDHFAVGVNSGIYDLKTIRRLAGRYMIGLYDKLLPLIEKKRSINQKAVHYEELEQLIRRLSEAKRHANRCSRKHGRNLHLQQNGGKDCR